MVQITEEYGPEGFGGLRSEQTSKHKGLKKRERRAIKCLGTEEGLTMTIMLLVSKIPSYPAEGGHGVTLSFRALKQKC